MRKNDQVIFTALVLLLASAMTVSAVDKVEIRGPVALVQDGENIWGPQAFAGFYYDIDEDLGRESLTLTITEGNVLAEDTGVVYRTEAQPNEFDFEEWGEYMTIGFLADEYFAAYVEGSHLFGRSDEQNLMKDEQLSKVLMDDDESRTFTSGTPLKLAEGYELAIQSIDLDGNKVFVQLMKDGAVVNSAVVEPSKAGADITDKTYVYKKDMGDTEKIVIIAVHFKNAFRGADTDLATIDGIWQISDTPTPIKEDTEYDKMTIQTVDADAMTITMANEDNKITLTKKRDVSLMENIRIKTADQDATAEDPLRFFIYKEITEPGTYEIRGSVKDIGMGTVEWDSSTFAGFYYDIDDNLGNERITMTITDGNVLAEDTGVIYTTEGQNTEFDFAGWGEYATIGFLAEEYFAAYVEGSHLFGRSDEQNLMKDEQLSKVLMDDDSSMTFTSGTPLKLAEGYELAIQSIDLDGNKVFVQLMKDGAMVNSAVVEPSKAGAEITDKTYVYKKDMGDTEKIVIIAVHFKNAFRGADTDLATVNGIWQISDTPTSIKEDTEYDKMTIQTVDADARTITMSNEDNKITLTKKRDVSLMENIRIKTADQDEGALRFYIYKEMKIEGEEAVVTPEPVVAPEPVAEPVAEEPAVAEPVVEEPVAEEPVEESAVEAPAPEDTSHEKPKIKELVAKLSVGLIAFKSPLKMKEGVEYPVEVRISGERNTSRTFLSEGLEGPGVTQIKEIKVGDRMRVSLEGDEEDFKIVELFDSNIDYTVASEPYKNWTWKVTPLRSGDRKLVLNVYVAIERPGAKETWDKAVVMSETIDVSVSYPYEFKNFIITNIEPQWLISAIIIPIVLYIWRSKRRK